jgi:cytidylate kinase
VIITLSGPAASGKGTLAKMLAKELNLPHYDFGLIFRAIAFLNTRFTLEKIQNSIERGYLRLENEKIFFRWLDLTEFLKTEEVGLMAARLANGNFTLLAAMAKMMVGHESFICDGRNVDEIYPEADFKFYIQADVKERIARRLKEAGDIQSFRNREKIDTERLIGFIASNKIVIDTTGKTPDESLHELLSYIH